MKTTERITMCLNYPGPRCSGHTRINFRKAKENLLAANADLKAKQEALAVATTAEAHAELHASEKAHAVALAELNTATAKYDESKAKRAVAMEAYHKAKDEYDASPEGIKKNRMKSVDKKLTAEQREEARKAAIEGNATRNRQKEAYAFKKALDEAEKTAPTVEVLTEEEKTLISYVGDPENSWQTKRLFNLPGDVHPAIQDAIVRKGDGDILQAMASSPKCSAANLTRIAKMDDKYAAISAINNRNATVDTMKAGVHHSIQNIRESASNHDTWDKHCNDKGTILNSNEHLGWSGGRQRLADSQVDTPLETLQVLSKDEDPSVRSQVARHPNTPQSIIKEMLEDPDRFVRGVAVRRDPVTNVLAFY